MSKEIYDRSSPHKIGSLGWAMDNSFAVRWLFVIIGVETGLLLGLLLR